MAAKIIECMNGLTGDKYPGFGGNEMRKVRIPLPEYNISARKGLRLIYLCILEKKILIPIYIYKKGLYQETKTKNKVKGNLNSILTEIDSNNFSEIYP